MNNNSRTYKPYQSYNKRSDSNSVLNSRKSNIQNDNTNHSVCINSTKNNNNDEFESIVSRSVVDVSEEDYGKYDWVHITNDLYLIEDKKSKIKHISTENCNSSLCAICGTLGYPFRSYWQQNMIFCAKCKAFVHWGCTRLSFQTLRRISQGNSSFHCRLHRK